MLLSNAVVLIPLLARTVSPLRATPGSPCTPKCGSTISDTTGDEIVCRDHQYAENATGSQFQECVECELGSTHFITEESESDVEWGLFNLRYAFSTCIYGVPVEKQSLSTPCQVSCETLREAITHKLNDTSGFTSYDFCGLDSFADSIVTKCADCYSLTDDEKYLANFIESIRQGCHSEIPEGAPFILEPSTVFSTEAIPHSTTSTAAKIPGSEDGKPKNLVVIIVIPIIGFLILVACLVIGCFCLVRHRRRKANRHSHSAHLHDRWNDKSIITPMPGGLTKLWNGEPQQTPGIYSPYTPQYHNPGYYSPGPQQGDIKYPPEAYVMETHPSSPAIGQQHQPSWPEWTQQEQQVQQVQHVQQAQHASMPRQDQGIPILADPPPPRKSLSKQAE